MRRLLAIEDGAAAGSPKWRELCAIGVVLIPALILIWSPRYWPGYHDSIHIAITHVLRSLETPGGPFEAYVEGNLAPTTYSLHYWVLLALARVVSLPVADRAVVTALTLLAPVALYFAAVRLSPAQRSNAVLYAPFALSWTIVTGMHAFEASLSAALVGCAFLVGLPEDAGRGRRAFDLGMAALAFAVGVLAHPFAVALGGVLAASHAWRDLLSRRRLGHFAVAFLPASAILLASYAFGWHESAAEIPVRPASLVSAAVAFAKAVTGFSLPDLAVHLPLVALVCWGVVRRARRRDPADRALLRTLIALAALLAITPDWLSDAQLGFRVTHALLVMAFVFADVPLGLERKTVVALLFAIGGFLVERPVVARLSETIEQRLSLAAEIPRGSTLLPIDFSRPDLALPTGPLLFEPRVGSITLLPPAWGYLVTTRDVMTPFFWAAGGTSYMSGASYRPLRYKQNVSADFLPLFAPLSPALLETPSFCANLRLEPLTEDCALWRRLRYRSFVWMGLAYDRVLVAYAPKAFLSEIGQEMELVARQDEVYLFRPKPGRTRPTLARFLAE
jgi:hypothetical protein